MATLESVDLSPITLTILQWQGRSFQFKQPLVLTPFLDEESQELYVVEVPELTLLAYATTREQLLKEISEQVAFMWDAYVKAPEDTLASDVLSLRTRLVETMVENRQHAA